MIQKGFFWKWSRTSIKYKILFYIFGVLGNGALTEMNFCEKLEKNISP